jgi:hypothetical protein
MHRRRAGAGDFSTAEAQISRKRVRRICAAPLRHTILPCIDVRSLTATSRCRAADGVYILRHDEPSDRRELVVVTQDIR